MSALSELEQLQKTALAELEGVDGADSLEQWRIKYIGSKGAIKDAMGRGKGQPKRGEPAYG